MTRYDASSSATTPATFVSDGEARCAAPAAEAGAFPRVALTLGVGAGGVAYATRQLAYYDPGFLPTVLRNT